MWKLVAVDWEQQFEGGKVEIIKEVDVEEIDLLMINNELWHVVTVLSLEECHCLYMHKYYLQTLEWRQEMNVLLT